MPKYCILSNLCDQTICCNDCKDKKCIYRCYDDPSDCTFITDEEVVRRRPQREKYERKKESICPDEV